MQTGEIHDAPHVSFPIFSFGQLGASFQIILHGKFGFELDNPALQNYFGGKRPGQPGQPLPQ